MPQVWRITDRSTFTELRRRGRRARRGPLAITWLPGAAGTPPRVAFAVGRRVGGAVARNRLRRRLREAFRALDPPAPPGAYLVSAGPPAARTPSSDLRVILTSLVAETAGGETPPPAARDHGARPS